MPFFLHLPNRFSSIIILNYFMFNDSIRHLFFNAVNFNWLKKFFLSTLPSEPFLILSVRQVGFICERIKLVLNLIKFINFIFNWSSQHSEFFYNELFASSPGIWYFILLNYGGIDVVGSDVKDQMPRKQMSWKELTRFVNLVSIRSASFRLAFLSIGLLEPLGFYF